MDSVEIRNKFLKFFEERGHAVVPSSSLVPDDPSVLLTTAGMQQFKPYYAELDPTVTVHPLIGKPVGLNATSCQKSFRTSDIDEVGDERHLTFFEMLGNFSFGGYFKKEAIQYAYDFITKEMNLPISYVSIFEGKEDIGVPKDIESRDIWKSLDPNLEVREAGMDEVFWGPTGTSGPCGPTTEIYCKNAAGQDIEVWNIVFNQFFYPGSREELNSGAQGKKLEPLKTPGVDTGMGLERLVMCAQKTKTIFETDLFSFFNLLFRGGEEDVKSGRIIADHIRGAMFLISDGITPANKGAGYILRRLIRRAMVHANKAEIKDNVLSLSKEILMRLINAAIDFYKEPYPRLGAERENIISVFERELDNFGKTLKNGLREFNTRFPGMQAQDASKPYEAFVIGQEVGRSAFDLYQSYGFPVEVIKELLESRFYKFNQEEFNTALEEAKKKHQE
ncbi:MAG: alanine--tRNA ligase-related protein, partial [bacterium]|nr:alanine--tRNA ligase-related protein [bacterium]